MCLAVYIAGDGELPLVPFDRSSPSFSVEELLPEEESTVRPKFTRPNIRSVGASEGCGCGFGYARSDGRMPVCGQPDDVRWLKGFLEKTVEEHGGLELFACWDGEQSTGPLSRRTMSVREMDPENFWLREREFVRVVP